MNIQSIAKELSRRNAHLKDNSERLKQSQAKLDGEIYDVLMNSETRSILFVSRSDQIAIVFTKTDRLRKRMISIVDQEGNSAMKGYRAIQQAYDLITFKDLDRDL